MAGDLYCDEKSSYELLHNWKSILSVLQTASISIHKTATITPNSTKVLGWIWSESKLFASPHGIATLSTCSWATTVKALWLFLEACKFLSSSTAHPFSNHWRPSFLVKHPTMTSCGPKKWITSFTKCNNIFKNTIPPHTDNQPWLVTDGAVKTPGLGSTLYIHHKGKIHFGGYFRAKLKQRQNI